MEWTMVGVIVTLAGLIGTIIKFVVPLNTNLVENTMAIKALTETTQGNEARNEKEHSQIWDELKNHDGRISNIERK